MGIALPLSPLEVPGTGPATQVASSTAALLAADTQPSVLQPSHSPISLMKACTISLLLSLGWAGLRSGWCLHGRTVGALVGRLLSRPAFGGGATAWEVDLWPGNSCPAAALGSNRAFFTASFPGPTAFSVAWVPGDSPTRAGDTSAGQQMAAGESSGSWLGVAAWGSSRGCVGTAWGTGTAGGMLLSWAVAAEGAGRGWVGAGARGALGRELSPASRACLLGPDTLPVAGLAGPPAAPTSLVRAAGDWVGKAGGSGQLSTGVAGGCPCRRAVPGWLPAGKMVVACTAAPGSL